MTRVKITSSIYLLKLSSATNNRPKSVKMDQNKPPNETTVEETSSANNMGKLKKLAKEMNQKAINKKLFQTLKGLEIGTTRIEHQALKMIEEGKSQTAIMARGQKNKGIPLIDRVRSFRDKFLVKGLIEMKIRQCQLEEDETKKEYRRRKRILENNATSKAKKRRFRRNIGNISKQSQQSWNKGTSRIHNRIEWLKEKYRGYGDSLEEQWLRKIALSSGSSRERIRVDVPV